MSREFDARDHAAAEVTADQLEGLREAVAAVGAAMPGDQTVVLDQVDPQSGTAGALRFVAGVPIVGDVVDAVLEQVGALGEAFCYGSPVPFGVAPMFQPLTTSSGTTAVHLRQTVASIPVFQAAMTVHISPDQVIEATAGTMLAPATMTGDVPRLAAADALAVAARYLAQPDPDIGEDGFDLSGLQPAVESADDGPEQATVLTAPPFDEPVNASLTWFGLDGTLRLAWQMSLSPPDDSGAYFVIVDATDGTLLYCASLVRGGRARGDVSFPTGDDAPVARFLPPEDFGSYPVPDPGDMPGDFLTLGDWIIGDVTAGNNVIARDGVSINTLRGVGTAAGLVFSPADPLGADQWILNAAYYCNYMHDVLYLLGFREADRNFQQENYPDRPRPVGGGGGGDPVDARVYPFPVKFDASMTLPGNLRDGESPVLKLGTYHDGSGRHTALDAGLVFHEYTHGLTHRLVGAGAPAALRTFQGDALGEGWSDYVACTLLDTDVVAPWVSGQVGGIRTHPYDDDHPGRYGSIGTNLFLIVDYTDPHTAGEIWCAALMALNRRIGSKLVLQVVVDALKHTCASPTYIQARNEVLRALRTKLESTGRSQDAVADAMRQAWGVFAGYGMGFNAPEVPSGAKTGYADDGSTPADPLTVPAARRDRLQSGERLRPGDSITSASGGHTLIYQTNGELALYRNRDNVQRWSSLSAGRTTGFVVMRPNDGNFVVYDAAGVPAWQSGTAGAGNHVVLQDDGNLVVYHPDRSFGGWASWTQG